MSEFMFSAKAYRKQDGYAREADVNGERQEHEIPAAYRRGSEEAAQEREHPGARGFGLGMFVRFKYGQNGARAVNEYDDEERDGGIPGQAPQGEAESRGEESRDVPPLKSAQAVLDGQDENEAVPHRLGSGHDQGPRRAFRELGGEGGGAQYGPDEPGGAFRPGRSFENIPDVRDEGQKYRCAGEIPGGLQDHWLILPSRGAVNPAGTVLSRPGSA